MEVASPSSDRDLQAGLHPSASSNSISRDSNMASKLQNGASLTIRLLQQITDNFSEERKIGQGAYGTVYKGVHANGEEIAVKLLRNNLQGTDDEQFKREFENLMRLDHHNIVQLAGYCYETHHKPMLHNGETIYAEETNRVLCFEYMRNGSLQRHISEECDGLDWHTRYGIIKGTCEGLKYLHEGFKEPIYHMDLKPDNILLDENMMPKLADFGLSKLYDGEQSMITQILTGTINHITEDVLAQGTRWDSRDVRDQNPSFKDSVRSDLSAILEGAENEYTAAEDDSLPGIDGLRITGKAFPGIELQASGYSINGTTSCNFQWVRHLEDGSMNFLEGERQLTYLVTADDVDTLLAIEVQPLADRETKGDIVKVYANEQRKISCDPETKELIKQTLSVGHVSYEVLLPAVPVLETWEPAVLAVTRKGCSIKCNGQRGGVVTETFQQYMAIRIPCGRPTEFSLQSADGDEYSLKPAENSPLLRRLEQEDGAPSRRRGCLKIFMFGL